MIDYTLFIFFCSVLVTFYSFIHFFWGLLYVLIALIIFIYYLKGVKIIIWYSELRV